MRIAQLLLVLWALWFTVFPGICPAENISPSSPAVNSDALLQLERIAQAEPIETNSEGLESEAPEAVIADPLEPINRGFFKFNDKLYFWILKPVARGYRAVIPQPARLGVRNFFSNLTTPIRLVNCLLQAKFKSAGTETLRFVMNTTLGLGGLLDPAKEGLNIDKKDEDLGQTLGFLGMGSAFYIHWPLLGPSSLRDSVGFVGDMFLDPLNYLVPSFPPNFAVRSFDRVNNTSFTIGEYEDLKKAAIDPYTAVRDAYYQHRQSKIKK